MTKNSNFLYNFQSLRQYWTQLRQSLERKGKKNEIQTRATRKVSSSRLRTIHTYEGCPKSSRKFSIKLYFICLGVIRTCHFRNSSLHSKYTYRSVFRPVLEALLKCFLWNNTQLRQRIFLDVLKRPKTSSFQC